LPLTVFCLSFRILSEVEGGGICFCPCRCLFFVVVCFCCHPERAQRVEGPRRSPPNQNRPSLSPNQSALTAHTSQPIAQTKKRRVPIHSAFFAEWVGYRAVARPGGSRGLQAPETMPSKKRASALGLLPGMAGCPSIPRSLRNGWDIARLRDPEGAGAFRPLNPSPRRNGLQPRAGCPILVAALSPLGWVIVCGSKRRRCPFLPSS